MPSLRQLGDLALDGNDVALFASNTGFQFSDAIHVFLVIAFVTAALGLTGIELFLQRGKDRRSE